MIEGGRAAMGRRSQFSPKQNADAVLAVLTKRKKRERGVPEAIEQPERQR
jgi:hypothetical protein